MFCCLSIRKRRPQSETLSGLAVGVHVLLLVFQQTILQYNAQALDVSDTYTECEEQNQGNEATPQHVSSSSRSAMHADENKMVITSMNFSAAVKMIKRLGGLRV